MSKPSRVRSLAILSTVSLAVVLSGCAGQRPHFDPEPPTVNSLPQDVQDPAELPEDAGVDDSCNPLASYDPSDSTGGADIQTIIDRGRLKVGVDQTTYLMGYRDPQTGDMAGFDIQIARQIAKDLLGDPDKIQYVAMSSEEREDSLKNDQVDLVVRTMTINCARWKDVEFSGEYYHAGQKVLVPSDASDDVGDLAGKKVCSAEGSTSLLRIEDDLQATAVSVRDWADCLILVQQGEVDAMSTDDVILAGMAAQDPNTKVIGDAISDEPYGVAAKKGNVGLIKFVNSTLDRIRDDGTWQDIYQDTLADTLGDAKPPKPKYGRD